MQKCLTRILTVLCLCALLLSGCGAQETPSNSSPLDPENPVTVTLWNYYSGDLLTSFNALVDEFNATAGKELGVRVESYSQGDVNDLAKMVEDAVSGAANAEKTPNIFSAYADTAYAVDQMDALVDLSDYLTEEEIASYVDGYIDEGRFGEGVKIFPVAKSVEVLILNKTEWDKFAAATGASYDDLSTVESLTAAAEAYYNWTDSLTDTPNDGKALFGRDSVANYLLAGAMQLGTEILSASNGSVTLDFDHDTVRKLWDNFYVPLVKGCFDSQGRFRSDGMKTGTLIAYVGSSSGATFIPTSVAVSDTELAPIEVDVLPCPKFAGGRDYATQQGAGMVVTKGSDAEVLGSIEFLKWFTQAQRNTAYSVVSGYLPVTKEANSAEALKAVDADISPLQRQVLEVAMDTVRGNQLYTPHAFANASAVRSVLEYGLEDLAAADRATVEERLAQGMSLPEAAAEFLSDDYFEAWYADTLAQLQALCG